MVQKKPENDHSEQKLFTTILNVKLSLKLHKLNKNSNKMFSYEYKKLSDNNEPIESYDYFHNKF